MSENENRNDPLESLLDVLLDAENMLEGVAVVSIGEGPFTFPFGDCKKGETETEERGKDQDKKDLKMLQFVATNILITRMESLTAALLETTKEVRTLNNDRLPRLNNTIGNRR